MQHQRFFRRPLVLRDKTLSKAAYDLVCTCYFHFHGKVRRNQLDIVSRYLNESYLQFILKSNLNVPVSHIFGSGGQEVEYKNLSRYCKPQPTDIDEYSWAWAQRFAYGHIYPHVAGAKVVSQEVAWASLEKTTSPGYPWSMLGTCKDDVWKLPGFPEYMELYYDTLGTPNEWTPIWTSSVKSEMRATSKVLDGALRTFVAAPLEHTLASSRVFLDFNERLFKAGAQQRCWIKVGMSKFRQGWHRFVVHLSREGDFKVGKSLDVSKNDSSLHRKMYFAINNLKLLCLNNSNPGIASKIFPLSYQVVNGCIVLLNGDIVEKDTGNNSGSGQTTVDNSISLLIMFAYCYCMVFRATLTASELMASFIENVEAAMYGDDLTFMVSDSIKHVFNGSVLRDIFLTHGYVLTHDDVDWDLRDCSDLTFLSNRSVYLHTHSLYVSAPVDREKIRSSLLYGSKCADVRWHVLRTCALLVECFFDVPLRRELSMYLEFLLSEYAEEMVDGVVFAGVSWREIRSLIRSPGVIERLYIGCYEVARQ